eukprot:m.34204 g.34204  ORF g.34204 m.34204 type:complete len:52 (-) comp9745_c0_seq1:442-597(-)
MTVIEMDVCTVSSQVDASEQGIGESNIRIKLLVRQDKAEDDHPMNRAASRD